MSDEYALIVDLDDTLVYTCELNNDAYNYALEQFGYPRIESAGRITRKDIAKLYPDNSDAIIALKQSYFARSWMPCRTQINKKLLDTIATYGKNNCILWTSAERSRASKVVSHYGLNKYFGKTLYDKKSSFGDSVRMIKSMHLRTVQ